MTQLLQDLEFFGAELRVCPDWQRSPELEPVMLELTLSRKDWQQVNQALARAGLAADCGSEHYGQLLGGATGSGTIRAIKVWSCTTFGKVNTSRRGRVNERAFRGKVEIKSPTRKDLRFFTLVDSQQAISIHQ